MRAAHLVALQAAALPTSFRACCPSDALRVCSFQMKSGGGGCSGRGAAAQLRRPPRPCPWRSLVPKLPLARRRPPPAPAALPPRRWEQGAAQLQGGARSVACCLCPVRLGAFKRTVPARGGERGPWCHLVCGTWQNETNVLPGNICDAITGGLRRPGPGWLPSSRDTAPSTLGCSARRQQVCCPRPASGPGPARAAAAAAAARSVCAPRRSQTWSASTRGGGRTCAASARCPAQAPWSSAASPTAMPTSTPSAAGGALAAAPGWAALRPVRCAQSAALACALALASHEWRLMNREMSGTAWPWPWPWP
jgi:hypothetical protein